MILWTIQKSEVWEQLKKTGFISGEIDYIEKSWGSSYRWMIEKMKGVALFYMHTSGDMIISAWIYPFVTDFYKNS